MSGHTCPPQTAQPQAAQDLLTFEHPDIRKFMAYTYNSLPVDKKQIRLIKLKSGAIHGNKIYCELVHVEYDNVFHVLKRISDTEFQTKNGGLRSGKKRKRAVDEVKGDCTDLETRSKKREKWRYGEPAVEKRERMSRQMKRDIIRQVNKLTESPEDLERETPKNLSSLKEVLKQEQKYEALSWCWGEPSEDYAILIMEEGKTYRKKVRKDLALALKYLRDPARDRYLWVDAICIDQENPNERNHQVQMMSRIYTRAERVCIWLGEADETSDLAMKFIEENIKHLRNFDTISSSSKYSERWQALMLLMQRRWFFRRWVVQEIALAQAATVYCGTRSAPWKLFAIAVELFVETETLTHRMSDSLMQDGKYSRMPGRFDYVSELGASQLVQATGKVFRSKATPMEQDIDESDEEDNKLDRVRYRAKQEKKRQDEEKRVTEMMKRTQTIDPLDRRSLLSLEYLVSTMSIFQASEPRDVVYALLALARDASPFAPSLYGQDDQNLLLIMTLLDRFLAEKPFTVDYNRPYSDVSHDFVAFTITRAHKIDPVQALDILCRPWALEPPKERSKWLKRKRSEDDATSSSGYMKRRMLPKRKKWKIFSRPKNNPNAPKEWREDKRRTDAYWREVEVDYAKEKCGDVDCRHDEEANCWISRMKRRYLRLRGPSEDMELPLWVARASHAPFLLDHAPGLAEQKTSRANADSLVGPPLEGHRNYNAAGSQRLDLDMVIFRKRPALGHYSLYLKGFVLETVSEVGDQSQLGGIPTSWLKMGGWENFNKDPPDEFWRTIVADRGRNNRNPPHYYARACKEAVQRGGHRGGCVNTEALIKQEKNSVVAEFCRRIQAVIWNRRLFRTESGRLGISSNVEKGDVICILYGCTVPIILRKHAKFRHEADEADGNNSHNNNSDEMSDDGSKIPPPLSAWGLEHPDIEEDRVEMLKSCILRMENSRLRCRRYLDKKKQYKDNEQLEIMDARYHYLEEAPVKNAREALVKAVAARLCNNPRENNPEIINELAKSLVQEASASGSTEASYNTIINNVNSNGINEYLPERNSPSTGIEEESPPAELSIGIEEEGPPAEQQDEPIYFDLNYVPGPIGKMTDEEKELYYEFLGECYLHGMMDGEAMRERFYTDKKDCMFELR